MHAHRPILIAGITLMLSFSGTAAAAPVKGKILGANPSQYSVLVLKKNGQATIKSVASSGSFSVNASNGATLHLIGSDSRYFGPIVAAKGVKGYATMSGKKGSLGGVTVKTSFATVPYGKARNVLKTRPSLTFNAVSGTVGSGKFGLVSVSTSSLPPRIRADALPGEDSDGDGLPNALDIDDDGDLVLDVSDADEGSTPEFRAEITSTLRTTLVSTVNKNITGISDSDIDSALSDGLILGFNFQNNSASNQISAVNADCGSLSYCAPGTTTAKIRSDNLSQLEGTDWTAYDPDSDGLPNLVADSSTSLYIGVKPHVTRAAIRPGDVVNFIADGSSADVTIPVVIPFYFSTGPALTQYSSGAQSGTLSYPISQGGVGTEVSNPIVLGAGTLTMTLFKPQRPPVDGAESGDIDNGKLFYGLYLSPAGSTGGPLLCKPSEYSNPSTGLEVNSTPDTETITALTDTAADAASNPANTVSFTIDIATCLSRQGVSTSGTTVYIDLNATTRSGDQTSQSFYVRLP